MVHCYHFHSNCWMPVLRRYIVIIIIIIFIHHSWRNHSQLSAQHSAGYSLLLLLSCCLLQSYLHLFQWRHFVLLLTAECELTLSLACLFLTISFQMSDSLLFKQILMEKFLPLHILIAKVFLPFCLLSSFSFPSVSSFPATQGDACIYFSLINL